ncbi:hypothetical protein [Modestobacter sp. VKM Ac-2985]|uniref:hypothetical protein n=1 Tax=Modestobacter sp. VKM Ac-2985 TaxID=3004139 RepID=UPI0022AB957C|nr:hypothetical protein [Modestobacter sp. VKM Ac-2985]MCZ2838933.1 hypothetical protein [Modestobacter sp. VKM Ac-2985]
MSRVSTRRATVATGLALGTATLSLTFAPGALAAPADLPALQGPSTAVIGQTYELSGTECAATYPDKPATVYVDVFAAADATDPAAEPLLSLTGPVEAGDWTATLAFLPGATPGGYVAFALCEPYDGGETDTGADWLAYPEFSFTLAAAPVTPGPVTPDPVTPAPVDSTPTTVAPTGELRGESANSAGVASTKTSSTTGAQAAQGTKIVKVLTGFQPREKVTVTLHSEPQTVGTYTADADGTVTVSFTLPAGTPAGEHDLVFEGDQGTYFQESLTVTAASSSDSDNLAYTGASLALPLSLGGGLLVAGAGALFALRRRPAGAQDV